MVLQLSFQQRPDFLTRSKAGVQGRRTSLAPRLRGGGLWVPAPEPVEGRGDDGGVPPARATRWRPNSPYDNEHHVRFYNEQAFARCLLPDRRPHMSPDSALAPGRTIGRPA